MATGIFKIQEMTWGNITDLRKPEWTNSPIQSPYWSRRWEYSFVLQKMNMQDREVVCDAGSGNLNPLSVYFGKTFPNSIIYAVDLAPSPFPDTKQIKTLQEDLTKTSIPSDSVDKVICVSVLEHLPRDRWIPAINEFTRILKQEGSIVVTVDVEDEQGSSWNFKRHELEWFIKNVDPTAVIPPKPADVLSSSTGTLPGEKELHLNVLGFVAKVI